MNPPDPRRIPQPATQDGRDLAEALWKRRHELVVTRKPTDSPDTHYVEMTPALTMRIIDKTHLQYAMTTRQAWREGGECSVQYGHACHITREDKARWVVHAWRAAQAARMLRVLGVTDEVEDAPLCVPVPVPGNRVVKALAWVIDRLKPRRAETMAEALERRLDGEVSRRLSLMQEGLLLDVVDIGGGLTVDGTVYEPMLALRHETHGTISLTGTASLVYNERRDEMRRRSALRLSATEVGETGRIGRVIAICREAVAMDPEMTDDAGTPIKPLVDEHLPRLALRLDEATAQAGQADRDAIHDEVSETLQVVTRAIEQGMATRARLSRDALREELRFLAARHPVENP